MPEDYIVRAKGKELPVPADQYDALLTEFRDEGVPFEVIMPEVEIEGSILPEIEGLDPNRDDVALEEESARLTSEYTEEELLANRQRIEKDVRRAAFRSLTPDSSFIAMGQGPLTGDPYSHFEPSVEMAMNATDDTADLLDMRENGKDSAAYKAFADQMWKSVYDVHVKNNESVRRVEMLDAPMSDLEGQTADVVDMATKHAAAPLLAGFDMVAAAGFGQEVMSRLPETKSVEELMQMGVIGTQTERLDEIAESSPMEMPMKVLGGVIGSTYWLGKQVAKGAVKAAKATGAAGALGAAIEGVTSGAMAMGAEEAVETGGELLRGEDVSVPSAGDMLGNLLASGVMGVGAHGIGSALKRHGDALRHTETPGGDELNLVETLTGERGTSFTGKGGLTPGSVIKEESRRVAKQRNIGVGTDRTTAEKTEALYRQPTEKARKLLTDAEAKTYDGIKEDMMSYHDSPEGLKKVSTAPVRALLERMKRERSHTARATDDPASTMVDAVTDEKVGDILYRSTKKIDEQIEYFKKRPTMDARELDEALVGLDDLVQSNKSAIDANKVHKDVGRSLREVRDGFEGNEFTVGQGKGGWSATRTQHSNKIDAMERTREALTGQKRKYESTRDEYNGMVNSLSKLATSAEQDALLDSLMKDNPNLRGYLRQVFANEPFKKGSTGTGRIPLTKTGLWNLAKDPTTYTRLDPMAALLSRGLVDQGGKFGQLGNIGTGSEAATAAAAKLHKERDALRRLSDWDKRHPAEEER